MINPFSPPTAPLGPINISEVQTGGESRSEGSIRLSWKRPKDLGGLPLLRYLVQMRYANTPGWHRVTGTQRLEDGELIPTTLATGLMQCQKYIFRVAGVNEVGTGAFLESSIFEMPEDDSKFFFIKFDLNTF